MTFFLPSLLVASQLVLVADEVPRLSIEPSCHAVGQATGGRTPESCLNDENQAKGSLGERWTQFPFADRARCTKMVSTGGGPSYVELLTCLEMAEQARKLRGGDKGLGPDTTQSIAR